ncbi:antibiotic biosynthesis monooxygenase [Calidifontibacter terrae]
MTTTSAPEAVTVAITRRVQPGHEPQMHAWINAGTALAERSPGFLGTGWIRPRDGSDEWHMLYRFTDANSMAAWEESKQRKWWLESAEGLVEHDRAHRRVGIEGWFDQPVSETIEAPTAVVPPRWKQATMIWLAFFPISLVSSYLLVPVTGHSPIPLRVLVSTLILTPLMTYFFLPAMGRLLHGWLHR